MKKIFFLVFIICTCLISCLELAEETEIKENGSGQISTTIDMAQLIDMMQAMGGEEFEKKKSEKMDSVIWMKDMLSSSTLISEEQKRILSKGKCNIKMDLGKKEFFIKFQCPFNDIKDLQKLNNAVSEGGMGLTGIISKALGELEGNENSDLDKIMSVFDYEVENGHIARKINKNKLQKLNDDPKMAEMKQGAEMGIEILYTTVYKLPKPVKQTDNLNLKLSDDKKTVTIRTNLMEIFENSNRFAFDIKY